MADQSNFHNKDRRLLPGLFIIIIGVLLLLYRMGVSFLPAWLFTWPVFIIALGLFFGTRHGFRTTGWLIMVLVGSLFLLNQQMPELNLDHFIAPIVLIGVGLIFITRPRYHSCTRIRDKRYGGNKRRDLENDAKESGDITNVNRSDGEYMMILLRHFIL